MLRSSFAAFASRYIDVEIGCTSHVGLRLFVPVRNHHGPIPVSGSRQRAPFRCEARACIRRQYNICSLESWNLRSATSRPIIWCLHMQARASLNFSRSGELLLRQPPKAVDGLQISAHLRYLQDSARGRRSTCQRFSQPCSESGTLESKQAQHEGM